MEELIGPSLEQRLMTSFQDEGLDIQYTPGNSPSLGQVENRWGTVYSVDIKNATSCYAPVWGDYSFNNKRITIQEPCLSYASMTYANSNEEIMVNTLAHQLGHADTYGLSIAIQSALLVAGIQQSFKKRSFLPIAYSIVGYTLWRVVGDELLAETAASLFHKMSFFRDLYIRLPDIGEIAKAVFDGLLGLVD